MAHLTRRRAYLALAAARVLPVALLLTAWEAFSRSGAVTPFMLPEFSAVLARIYSDALSGDLFFNCGVTLYRTLVGFVVASIVGVAIGSAMSSNAFARWFFDPIISVGFPMPKIAFLPVIILWLGLYDTAKISMVALDAMFPVVTATVAGFSSVEKELLWSARNMGAREREMLWQVLIPAALPQIFTGLQVALPIAMIVAVVAEMQMGGYGLGAAMMAASRFADSRGVFAGIVEIAVIGYALVYAMAVLRRRLLSWHQETQTTADL